MKNCILLLSLIIFTIANAGAQKVASFSYGTYGQDDYEAFSFWVKANNRGEILYEFGKGSKSSKVTFVSKDVLNGEPCFKIKFSNNYTLYVIPKATQLKISDLTGKYMKFFAWKYEGPVNGVGTFCEPCAADDKEAINLINMYYMK